MRHLEWDGLYILVFSMGQFIFMLKRADLARRSPLNSVGSIRNFFALNWIVLLFRAVVEWGVVLWPYRSASASSIQWIISKIGFNIPFQLPAHRGLAGAFFAGVAADLVLDWVMMQSWMKNVPILNLMRENIPQLPQVQQLVETIKQENGKG